MNDRGIGRHLSGGNSVVKESFTTGVKDIETLEGQLADVRKQMAGYLKELGV